MIAMMFDIETLSLKPTAQVTQIGMCAANLRTGEYLIAPYNMFVDQHGGVIDLDTVGWWMRQSDAARTAVFPEGMPRFNPAFLLGHYHTQYTNLGGEDAGVTVWASPAMFDFPILTSAFGGEKPWPYNMERDLMTLYKMLDPEKKLKPTNPIEHDAASDAKAQMDNLIAIFQTHPTLLQGAK
jgi:hypothetical protein